MAPSGVIARVEPACKVTVPVAISLSASVGVVSTV
jgi:hypothetical protein